MSKVEAVVFDIGNVLIEWQPERYYDALIGEERRRAMFAEVDLHAINDRSDSGEDLADVIAEAAVTYPDWAAEIRIWHEKWIELAAPAIPHSVRLLRALRGNGVPVFALSNFGIQTFEIAEKEYPFLNEFDRKYISGHMAVIKPAPLIYQMVEDDCGIAPGGLLFADDRTDNIEAAEARGWQGHIFTTSQGFADRLIAEGLLSAAEAV